MAPKKAADNIEQPKAAKAPRKSRAKPRVEVVVAPTSRGVETGVPAEKKPRKRKATGAAKTDPPCKRSDVHEDVIHFSMGGPEQLMFSDDDEEPTPMVPMEYDDPNPSSYTEVVDTCLDANVCKDEGNYADDEDLQDKMSQDVELFGDTTMSDDECDKLDETPTVVPLVRLEKKPKPAPVTPRFSGLELQLEPDSE